MNCIMDQNRRRAIFKLMAIFLVVCVKLTIILKMDLYLKLFYIVPLCPVCFFLIHRWSRECLHIKPLKQTKQILKEPPPTDEL